ncbi:MAG TPA: chorismate mutase [Chitinophagaceae bacterium]|nr:chorismate mutase [Chitinophagaceae bacterium]HAN39323.1 chorismate mutase [Chitinophagaceae bacterium]
MDNVTVAIQGFEGSFHEMAARSFFGKEVAIQPYATFREVAQWAASEYSNQVSVMAIENSIAGSILPNYSLLQQYQLNIIGEVYLHIHQHLLVNKGVQLQQIQEVHSHPMALLQCMQFLEAYPFKLIETADTALSAKQLQASGSTTHAVIASKLAAELFNLEVLAPNIHTMRNNYTRFWVLAANGSTAVNNTANKASLQFEVAHTIGSLATLLTQMASLGLNVSKLQSMPIPGTAFSYMFYADVEFETIQILQAALPTLTQAAAHLQVLGIYHNNKHTIEV